MGADIDYVLVKTFNQYTFEPINIILAKALGNKQFGNKYFETSDEGEFSSFQNNHNNDSKKKIPYEILAEFKGSDMVENYLWDSSFRGSFQQKTLKKHSV